MPVGEVTGNDQVMRKKRGLGNAILGLTLGLIVGSLVLNYKAAVSTSTAKTNSSPLAKPTAIASKNRDPFEVINLAKGDSIDNSTTNLLFVGVMTAQKYLGSRARAVFETWGSELPGRIAFFSAGTSRLPDDCPELPLVPLQHVDDSYPPQKKSFLMLQYMWNNYGDKFEWFLRADDDLYVRTDRLEMLLRSVDSRKPRYIGQAGRGNSEEFGLLSLEYDENFCMGGPGVLMSRETLRRIVPHIKYCLKNLYTTHEDVELGRCVQRYAGIPCTWSYEMQSILYHNSSGDQAFTGNLKRKEVHRAITLHPVKSPPHMYRLHNYMRGLQIQDLQQKRVELHRDIRTMAVQLDINLENLQNHMLSSNVSLFHVLPGHGRNMGDTKILGVPVGLRGYKPRRIDEVVTWDFLSRSEYSIADSNPRRRIHSDVREGIEDVTREVMASINSCSRQRGRVVDERSALYGYRRVDVFGADTVLDLLLVYRKYRGRKVTLPVRRHVYLHQHFTGLEIRETSNGQEVQPKLQRDLGEKSLKSILLNFNFSFNFNKALDPVLSKVIHFILPLSGRHEVFRRFIKIYEEICLLPGENTELFIILHPHKAEDAFGKTIAAVARLKSKYPGSKIDVIASYKNFSRADALTLGSSKLDDDDLLFFIDVDIVFTKSALDRIRLNTILNRQIYFPIVHSQFDPKIVYADDPKTIHGYKSKIIRSDDPKNFQSAPKNHDVFTINEFNGYWRQFGFGIVSIYKRDFVRIGGFDLSIHGWGKEDVDFFEKSVKSNLTIFRAVDRHLVHVYHEVECDSMLTGPQLSMCEGTRAETLAGVEQLASLIYGSAEYLEFAKNRRLKTSNSAA